MNTTPPNVSDNQEIDLAQISQRIGEGFDRFLSWIFYFIQFLIKNIIYFIVLGLIGLTIGYFLDRGNKSYNHEIYVNPNFGSTNLLYSKIDLLEAKILERDTLFLKSIGVKNPKSIVKIEIEPIVDIYGLVNERTSSVSSDQNTQNFELLKLLSESADINKIIKDDLTGRNYTTHLIQLTTKVKIQNQEVIVAIMDFLNDEEFFTAIQKEYLSNIEIKIAKNDETIKQIDAILDEFNSKTNSNQKNDKLIYYNENTQLNEIINTKSTLISDQGAYKLELIRLSKIVKDKSVVLNVKNSKSIFVKMKFIVPLILILGFILFMSTRIFYKKQLIKFKKRI